MSKRPVLRSIAAGSAVAGMMVVGLLVLKPYFRINLTDSMPKGLYAVYRGAQAPSRDRLAVVCMSPDWGVFARNRHYVGYGECTGDYASLLKSIAAVPGDILSFTEDGVWVNGNPVPNTVPLSKDSAGRMLMPYPLGDYSVEPGTVWVLSSHDPRSFDSRYFGPIAVDQIIGSAYPLITF